MSGAVLLDTGPLGVLANPHDTAAVRAAHAWKQALLNADWWVIAPNIAEYELRRELYHLGKGDALVQLDRLLETIDQLELTTEAWRAAAYLWGYARSLGQPTAAPDALDGDVILAAQAHSLGRSDVIVATANPKHLARFVQAAFWLDITP